jgi:outer membrane protein assembly factor BamB
VGSFDGFLYALEAGTGALLWKRKLGAHLYCVPLLRDDLVIVGSYADRLVALERASGRVRWVHTAGGRIVGGACLVGPDQLAFGAADGVVYLLEAATGRLIASARTGAAIRTTPCAIPGGFALPSCDGVLYAFRVAD